MAILPLLSCLTQSACLDFSKWKQVAATTLFTVPLCFLYLEICHTVAWRVHESSVSILLPTGNLEMRI